MMSCHLSICIENRLVMRTIDGLMLAFCPFFVLSWSLFLFFFFLFPDLFACLSIMICPVVAPDFCSALDCSLGSWRAHPLVASDAMLGFGRSRLPMPSRNRRDHQGQRPTLPCFPRWCGPMVSAVRGLSIISRPQIIPKWPPCQPGPYGMGRATAPHPSSLPQSWSMSQPLRSRLPEPRCVLPPRLVRLLIWFFSPQVNGRSSSSSFTI